MINVTKLYCGVDTASDPLRYGHKHGPGHGAPHATEAAQEHRVPPSASERRPVVVWNITRRCNLHRVHCYTNSNNEHYQGELTTEEGQRLLEDLATFRIPALLMSGGEPLIRPDFFELAQYARSLGLRLTLSTNGTLISEPAAQRIREIGFAYVGISFDGLGRHHDIFRGHLGAFYEAREGLRRLKAAGQKVGLRFTMTRHNIAYLDEIFDFINQEGIDRACFYHLVYSGRGRKLAKDDLTPQDIRQAIDRILQRTDEAVDQGRKLEVLTVDNHADGVYIYLKLLERDPAQAAETLRLLVWNGGGANSSGVGIGNIDWLGNVHPDQFWQDHTIGNVRDEPFSALWTKSGDPILAGLRNRLPLLTGRCGTCRFKFICGGSFRVRALRVHGDPWAPDPACYLTDEEVGAMPQEKR